MASACSLVAAPCHTERCSFRSSGLHRTSTQTPQIPNVRYRTFGIRPHTGQGVSLLSFTSVSLLVWPVPIPIPGLFFRFDLPQAARLQNSGDVTPVSRLPGKGGLLKGIVQQVPLRPGGEYTPAIPGLGFSKAVLGVEVPCRADHILHRLPAYGRILPGSQPDFCQKRLICRLARAITTTTTKYIGLVRYG